LRLERLCSSHSRGAIEGAIRAPSGSAVAVAAEEVAELGSELCPMSLA